MREGEYSDQVGGRERERERERDCADVRKKEKKDLTRQCVHMLGWGVRENLCIE